MWVLTVVSATLLALAHAGEVLIMPSTLHPAHRDTMVPLAEELVKRGHSVHWFEYGLKKPSGKLPAGVTQEFVEVRVADPVLYDLYVHQNHSNYARRWNEDFWDESAQTAGWMASVELCDRLLADPTSRRRFDELVRRRFDTVVVDDLYNPCGLLHTGLQRSVFIYWSVTGLRTESAWAHHSPSPPSYVPATGSGLTDELDFWERARNLAVYVKNLYVHQRVVLPRIDALIRKHFPAARLPDAFTLERNASINFVNHFPIFDFARPYMPRVNFVGCPQCRKGKALEKKLNDFVNASDSDGFVVISSGHSVQWQVAPEEVKANLLEAIRAKPKLRFVWQYDGPALKLKSKPTNLFIAEWLPLQDLLARPNCRTHVSHGGLNSVLESVFHGVPVVGWPLTIHNHDNLLRVTARHAGLMLEHKQPTRNQFISALNRVLVEQYKEEALIFQDMVTDVPYTELEHAAFWVEFIGRHQEVPHARSGADELNILQYFLVDVILFLAGAAFLILAAIHYTIKFTIRLLIWLLLWPFRRGASSASAKQKGKIDKTKKTN